MIIQCLQIHEETGIGVQYWWECKLADPFYEVMWQYLTDFNCTYPLAIPGTGICPKKYFHICKHVVTYLSLPPVRSFTSLIITVKAASFTLVSPPTVLFCSIQSSYCCQNCFPESNYDSGPAYLKTSALLLPIGFL